MHKLPAFITVLLSIVIIGFAILAVNHYSIQYKLLITEFLHHYFILKVLKVKSHTSVAEINVLRELSFTPVAC